jgi:acyl-CoA thioester hydrolase
MQAADSSGAPRVGATFRYAVPLRWGDQDALNHVNNTLYFRYLEEARIKLFERVGIVLPSARVMVLAHASLDFLKPMLYPATAVVIMTLTRVGRSSIEFDVLIECEHEPGLAYAKGREVLVGTDAASGRSLPWTGQELAAFARTLV